MASGYKIIQPAVLFNEIDADCKSQAHMTFRAFPTFLAMRLEGTAYVATTIVRIMIIITIYILLFP